MVYYTFLYVDVAFINILFSKGNWTVSASNGVTRTTRRVNIAGNFLTYITRYVVYFKKNFSFRCFALHPNKIVLVKGKELYKKVF